MKRELPLARSIDGLNESVGRFTAWLTLAMVILGAYNAVVRFLGKYTGAVLSANVYIELQWYVFSAVFLLGAAYTLKHGAHVHVDAIYTRLPPRVRNWINLLGTLLFLIPFCVAGILLAWPSVRNSWAVLEGSPDPGGLPRYPIKTLLPVAFLLLLGQGVSMAIRYAAALRGAAAVEDRAVAPGEGI